MADALTPEIIRAVFEHKAARNQEIEEAMRNCRPNAYASVTVGFLGRGTFWARAEFKTSISNDGRKDWKTDRENDDLDAACDQVLADIQAYKDDMFGTDVERLALAIIRIKHTDGVVTDRALRMDGFTQECITEIHERAALLANEMSDGKPFEVEFTGASNEEAA